MAEDLLAIAEQTPAVQDLRRLVESGEALSLRGISPAAQPFLAAVLHRLFLDRTIVVVTENLKAQEAFHQDLQTWFQPLTRPPIRNPQSEIPNPQSSVPNPKSLISDGIEPRGKPFLDAPVPRLLFYPAWEVLPEETRLPHADVISERIETLLALLRREAAVQRSAPMVVTSAVALLQRTFSPAVLGQRTRRLRRGDRIDPLDLIDWLEAQAYEPEAQVTQKGEIALRGGILDVFPLSSPWPVRLEFFGDELESLRYFDPHRQVSREPIDAVEFPPAGELGLLRRGPRNPADAATLLDYAGSRALLLLCDPERLEEQAEHYVAQVAGESELLVPWDQVLAAVCGGRVQVVGVQEGEGSAAIEETGEHSRAGESPEERAGHGPELGARGSEFGFLASRGIQSSALELPATPGAGTESASSSVCLSLSSMEAYRPITDRPAEPQVAEAQRRAFFVQMHRWLRQGFRVHVFCNNEGERQRFTEIWDEFGIGNEPAAARDSSSGPPTADSAHRTPQVRLGTLGRGFLFEAARLVVVTDAEVFGRYRVQRPRRLKSPHALATRSALEIDFTDLEEGDYVVHLQQGIGRYRGLQVLPTGRGRRAETTLTPAEVSAEGQECLVIEYAASDPEQPAPRLYVPVTEAHLVSKYVGAGKARPPLNTLGGTRWAKTKAQAEKAVRDLAGELLSIQAARESQAGHAFGSDTPWQREFESAFLFEETPDQAKAIRETKTDLELPKPMDRLICGDVGFGKTEVAIRAAFKAVLGGKQVAVLVPTTVLAQQHYNTFRERMADYPVRIDLLSRFRTRRQQQQTLRDIAAGAVDIVIGTHRLIQSDVAFKDLGLVVIDEEQRFGVMQKENFKRLRCLVDVLTLSATPIPRTLYLALTGARDMSTIETPPQDRLPVETIVTPYDERVIREAIERELRRGGQVFFLHNRVGTIDTMARRLENLVPEARILVGHGQMHSDDLEEVMTRFVNGEADILLSTTIIESGLDIPNANTIIIDRADRFGLSDLYQLRGRVGRYKHQAYAYLLIPRHAGLLSDARKRISAICQYSTLGSGFRIAMRDLEIRGSGNLLGPEQSGHITAVGFELYCQLLKQSVAVLKGDPVKPRVEVVVRIDFLALSPGETGTGTEEGGRQKAEDRRQTTDDGRQKAETVDSGLRTPDFELGAPRSALEGGFRWPAYLPYGYVADARQRIEVYRRLAQVTDLAGLKQLQGEVRDRFGPPPDAVERLFQVTGLKLLASERGITGIETREDRLMLTRNQDFVMVGGKFPRLGGKGAAARLKEIGRLLRAL